MCLGTPVQVVQSGEVMSLCRGRNGDEDVNMLLIGQQPVGTWILSFLGWAREILDEQQAIEINLALDGLQEIMDGADTIDVDRHFPGLSQLLEEAGP
jgi:hydrogenase expression/formation protein HypC